MEYILLLEGLLNGGHPHGPPLLPFFLYDDIDNISLRLCCHVFFFFFHVYFIFTIFFFLILLSIRRLVDDIYFPPLLLLRLSSTLMIFFCCFFAASFHFSLHAFSLITTMAFFLFSLFFRYADVALHDIRFIL